MPSDNAGRWGLSFLIVVLMILPSAISLVMMKSGSGPLGEDSSPRESRIAFFDPIDRNSLIPEYGDPSHGWNDEIGNIGEASLFHRTATYVPIQDWERMTGEREISGWHTLGHEYPLPSDWKSELEKIGMECRTFYAPQGFHCNVPGLDPYTLMEAGVIGAFRLDPSDKIAPDLMPVLNGEIRTNTVKYEGEQVVLVLLSGTGHLNDLVKTGVEIRDFRSERFVDVILDEKGVALLANQGFVEWMEPKYAAEFDNEEAADIVNVDWVSDPSNMGSDTLTGAGIIVGVMDSGLDDAVECSSISNCNFANADIDADFYGRIRGVVSYTCQDSTRDCTDGPEDPNGHGTHVAGSVLGDGSNSQGDEDNSGMAPGAQLFFQGVLAEPSEAYCLAASGNQRTSCPYLYPVDYEDFLQEAYDEGARIHTNSWGTGPEKDFQDGNGGCAGLKCFAYYSADTQELDEAAYDLQDLVILFAMGNDGMDCNYNSFGMSSCTGGKDGEINLGAMNRQATAKNIISIGASENFRPGQASMYSTACNQAGPCDLPFTEEKHGTFPISTDYRADNPEGMAAFSNRGPTFDQRIKPDFVAPGTFIKSVCTSEGFDGASDCSTPGEYGYVDGYYTFKQGTSMATPITAGSIALLIEHLNNIGAYDCRLAVSTVFDDCPESALIKAIMTAGSHDLEGQYNTGGDGENGAVEKAPNAHEGWGRIDLQTAVGAGFTSGIEITTSESHSFRLSIPDSGLENFRVVLAWNDPVNSASAGVQLVNDLDIQLKSPSGAIQDYTNDNRNNLVGITATGFPEAGDWEIIVTGENVADGAQKYYLASSAGIITDMRHPVSDGLNEPGFQSGSIFTETTMTAGGNHLCAIFDDASLQCWGGNSHGQLGDGTNTDRLTMTLVDLEEGRTAVSVSAGESHSCAIQDNGELVCWGRNNFGQLGDGTNGISYSPKEVGLSGVPVQISSGAWHSCAILNDASLECWGRNTDGQLGDNSNIDRSSPVSVSLGGKKALAVSTGVSHTCVVLNDWSLKCWGANNNGQLGIGSPSSSNSPETVTVGGNVVAVSAGRSHTCALLEDGDLKCWGDNANGQLGDGGVNQQNDASTVGNTLTGITSVDAGADHTCAIDTGKNVHCWGSSSEGQIGDGSTSSGVNPSVQIDLGQKLGALSVSAGSSHTCVVASNDLLRCWGGGDGGLSLGSEPEEFSIPIWSYISSSERDLNVPADGTMNIFHVNEPGDADGDGFAGSDDNDDGNPTTAVSCSPGTYGRFTCRVASPGYYVTGSGNTVMTAASPGHYVSSPGASTQQPCGVGTFQELSAQTSCDSALPGYYVDDPGASEGKPCPAGKYNNLTGQTSDSACNWADPGHSVPVLTQVSSGARHSCAILDDGSVKCWGDNANGQLGDGTRTDHHEPQKVIMPIGKKAVQISAGSYYSCAILDDGSVRCWGDNSYGQLGDGTDIERTSPVVVDLGPGNTALSLSSGESHTCAVLDDGSVKCWGENSNGQLGDGSKSGSEVPVTVDFGGSEVVKISAGSYHTCAIMSNRSVKCWGDNWHGQLGDGTNTDRLMPVGVQVPSNSSAVTIDAGAFHTCLGMNDGAMFCWGFNAYGQIGNGGTSSTNSPAAVSLDSTQSPTSIYTGLFHTCALFDNSQMSCWGDNSLGQLGDGTIFSQLLPNPVDLSTDALSISVGQRHSCSILVDASLECWGINSYGQLGDGTTNNRASPVKIDLGHGSKEQVPCSPGSYQPEGNQTSCILAERGYYVAETGGLDQVGCSRGYYSGLKGQAECTPASLGHYVESSISQAQSQCPEKHSTKTVASTNSDMCLPDFDEDMVPDVIDNDDDNDGVPDTEDFDPLDPSVSIDSDLDSIPDSIDPDDDNDGVNDTDDLFPNNQAEWRDNDMDGIGDNADKDDDGDGRNDNFDVFPLDSEEWSDFDGDLIGDNADADDDNDGMCDDPMSSYSGPPDVDNDGEADCMVLPNGDAFSLDPLEWFDTDGDSIGNQADTDDDGDGFEDSIDAFSLDPNEWLDSDSDNIGDNRDVFPNDSSEWQDTDGDSIGDNSDKCPYEAGINNEYDNMMTLLALPGNDLGCPVKALPGDLTFDEEEEEPELLDVSVSDDEDFDMDGIADIFDDDDDNDGIMDFEDGDLDPQTGTGKYSKDPGRPFSNQVWGTIFASALFLGAIGYRIAGWRGRKISLSRSKRIRIQ